MRQPVGRVAVTPGRKYAPYLSIHRLAFTLFLLAGGDLQGCLRPFVGQIFHIPGGDDGPTGGLVDVLGT